MSLQAWIGVLVNKDFRYIWRSEVIKQEFKNENPHEPPGVGGIDELEEKWVRLRRFNKKYSEIDFRKMC